MPPQIKKALFFPYFSNKVNVVGAQMNRLLETDLLSTKHIFFFELMDKKKITFLRSKMDL